MNVLFGFGVQGFPSLGSHPWLQQREPGHTDETRLKNALK